MSFFNWAQGQCSDIVYDLLKLENLHVRDIYNSAKWNCLRVNGIKKRHFKSDIQFCANK